MMANALFVRRSAAVLMALASATPALAETRVGVLGAHNTSTMSRADSQSQPWNTGLGWDSGWGGGAVVEIELRNDLTLASRPVILEKGSGGLALPGAPSTELHLRSLEIPLLVKYSWPRRVSPYVIAGPSLGVRLSAESVRRDYGDDHVRVEDSAHDTKPVELGFEAGMGVGLTVRRAYGFLEGAWAWGLTNVSESFGKNRGLQLRVGLTVRLGS